MSYIKPNRGHDVNFDVGVVDVADDERRRRRRRRLPVLDSFGHLLTDPSPILTTYLRATHLSGGHYSVLFVFIR